MKRALLINGSPRPEGNNAYIIDIVENELRKKDVAVTRIEMSGDRIAPCIHCRECERQKGCVVEDPMSQVYGELDRSDIIVVSCPLYFNGVTAGFKALVDRCQAVWASKYVLGDSMIDRKKDRKGLFICTGGQPEDETDFTGALLVAEAFFRVSNVKIWNKMLVTDVEKRPVMGRGDVTGQVRRLAKELT